MFVKWSPGFYPPGVGMGLGQEPQAQIMIKKRTRALAFPRPKVGDHIGRSPPEIPAGRDALPGWISRLVGDIDDPAQKPLICYLPVCISPGVYQSRCVSVQMCAKVEP
ncbi:MAG: hypothetical protein JKY43_08330 [Phycisphaerales bacterium]|nr:hypothetical protein [Phycisphaerales bacterium]